MYLWLGRSILALSLNVMYMKITELLLCLLKRKKNGTLTQACAPVSKVYKI